MNQSEIKTAVAQQEEHIRRTRSCAGTPDKGGPTLPDPIPGQSHSFAQYAAAPGVFYRACISCHVTETDADYQTKIGGE